MNKTIKQAADLLKLRYEVMEGDLSLLAFEFDRIIGAVRIITPSGAIEILYALVLVYLRGRGYRLGNKRSFDRHQLKAAWLATAVIARMEERGSFCYPRAYKVGLGGLEQAVKSLNKVDVMAEAEDIVRKHQF